MEHRGRVRVRALIALAAAAQILAALFGVLAPSPAAAVQTVPYLINFQGRLADNNGNVLSDGSYNVKFRLWDATSGGTNRWEGDRVYGAADHRISVQNGLFNIQFGDAGQGDPALSPSLFNTQTYATLYLEVELPTPATATCASNGCATWTEGAMTPRQPLATAAYAFNADALDGLDSSAFGQLAANNSFTGANTFSPGSGVALTVKPAASTDGLDVQNSSGVTKAYFDSSGNLNLGLTLQATSNNAIDLGTSGATFRTGYFGTSVVTPALNASSGGGTVATNAGELQRTASGTFTVDLNDGSNTTLAVQNSGTGVANLTVDGGVTVGTFASATSTPVCSNSGQLATCNSNPSGVMLQQAYAAGNTISTTGNDIGFTLNSGQNFTVSTTAGTTGSTTFSLATGASSSAPSQLVLVKNNNATQLLATGVSVQSAAGKITTAFDASGSNLTNALSIGTNAVAGTNFNVASLGDVTSGFTQLDGSSTTNGTGNSKTSMVLASVSNFDVGNYIRLQNGASACDGTATTCYAKITAVTVGTNTLTITPALTWATGKTVDEWHLPEVGGTDLAQTLTNRYGRGYFIAGVATGNGTTYYNEDSVDSTLTTFNLLANNVTTLNVGSSSTAVTLPGTLSVGGQQIVNGSGQIDGSKLQAASVANGALTNSSLTVSAGNGLTGGGSVALGASTSLAVAYGSTANTAIQGNTTLVCPSGSGNLTGTGNSITLGAGGTCTSLDTVTNPTFSGLVTASKSGASAFLASGTPLAGSGGATSSLLQVGTTAIASGNNTATTGGTWLGLNAASSGAGSTADYINFQNNGVFKFKVASSGLVDAVGGLSVNGTSVINSSAQVLGAQIQSASVANGALTNSSLTVSAGNGLTGGGSVALGASTSLAVAYGSTANTAVQGSTALTCPSGTGNLTGTGNTITLGSGGTCTSLDTVAAPTFSGLLTASKSGANALLVSGTPLAGSSGATSSLVQFGATAIASGNNTATTGGTWLGLNAASSGAGSTADFLNFQNNGVFKLKVDASGNQTLAGSITHAGMTNNGTAALNGATTVATGSSNAFQVQDASAHTLFNLDTSLMNLAVNTNALTLVNLLAPTSPGVAAGANTGGTLSGSSGTTYYYKVTALNSVGETVGSSSEPSINGANFTPIATPGAPTVALDNATAGFLGTGNYTYKVTFQTADGETSGGTVSATCTTTANKKECDLSNVPTGATGTTARKIYRTTVGGSSYFLVNTGATYSNNTAGINYTDGTTTAQSDANLGAAIPTSNTATVDTNNATVTWTAVTGATSYRVYRGTTAGSEDHYQTATSSPFTDTGATGTAASVNTVPSAGQVGIGTTAPGANLDVEGTGLFKNGTDSTTAFQVQKTAGATMFVADTTDSKIIIGSATADTTQILLQLDSYGASAGAIADTASCTTTTNQGALYYNTNTNAIRGCVNGGWEDVVTTAGLGIMLFGVVPDSGGAAPGDYTGITAAGAGPCKVTRGNSANTVRWNGCVAYSSGRKVIIPDQTSDYSTGISTTANAFQNLCLSTTNTNQPAFLGAGNTTDGSQTEPAFTAGSPVVCLATIKENASGNGVAQIYDTRAFTTSTKEFVNLVTTAASPGMLVRPPASGGTAGQWVVTNAAAGGRIGGVVLATDGSVGANTINGVVAVAGPAFVKAVTTGTVGDYIQTVASAGLTTTVNTINAAAYSNAGVALSSFSASACTGPNTDVCRGSVFTVLDIK
jgi:hypothetical protein